MIDRENEWHARHSRTEIGKNDDIEPWPADGRKFMRGCLFGMPFSALLWWLILQAASAMI